MKITLEPTQFIFTPSTNKIDFSPMLGQFKPYRLLAITNVTTGKLIYSVAAQPAGYNGTFSTTVYPDDTLTYVSSNAGQLASDIIEVLYDSDTQPQLVSGTTSSYILDSATGSSMGGVADPSGGGYKLKTASSTLAGDGTPILSTVDPVTGNDGLNVHLQSSTYGGQLGSPLPSAGFGYQGALSMGFLNGSVLAAPKMDPVTNELIVQANFAAAATQNVNLTEVNGSGISLGQNTMANSLPVTVASDQPLEVEVIQSVSQDILGVAISGNRNNQIEISFNTAPGASLITNTFTGSGAASVANGHTIYSTGATATSSARGISVQTTTYRPAHEIYAAFTAAFLNPTAFCQSRIGLFDNTDGFSIGYDGILFSIFVKSGGIESGTDQSSFNVDTLTGAAGSKFTRNGVPEAINTTFSNLFRIRFAWLGSANIYYEVFSPDGDWVLFHNIRQPNSAYNPSITNPNLPMQVQVNKTSGGATNSSIATACWGAGTTSAYSPITSTLNDNTLAAMTRSVITGVTTGGGGGYVNVKVNPSGSLVVENTQSGTANQNVAQYGGVNTSLGLKAAASSMPVVLSSDTATGNITTQNLNATGAGTAGSTVGITSTGYGGAVIDVRGTYTGTIAFQTSIDGTNWITTQATPYGVVQNVALASATTTGQTGAWIVNCVGTTQVRASGSSAITGTAVITVRGVNSSGWVYNAPVGLTNAITISSGTTAVTQAAAANLNCTAAVTGATLSAASTTDIASAAITTTQTSANIATTNLQGSSFAVFVTAISGASAAMDVEVQETMNGTNYYTIYTFERITATGQYYSPVIKQSGIGLRYIRTISGTTPSVTNSVVRISRQGQAETVRRFINRTIDPNTLNSNTGSFFCDGVEDFNLTVRCTAQTTPATIALEFSMDNTNWFTSATTVATIAGIAQAKVSNEQWKFVRATVTAAGTGITLGDVTIGGHSA